LDGGLREVERNMLEFAFHTGATAIAGQLLLGAAGPTFGLLFVDIGFGTLAAALGGGAIASFVMLASMNRRERQRDEVLANFSRVSPPTAPSDYHEGAPPAATRD